MHVHGRDVAALRDPDVDASYNFDAVIEFDYDMDVEEFVKVEYRTWINVFENEFSEAELYYPEPDNHY